MVTDSWLMSCPHCAPSTLYLDTKFDPLLTSCTTHNTPNSSASLHPVGRPVHKAEFATEGVHVTCSYDTVVHDRPESKVNAVVRVKVTVLEPRAKLRSISQLRCPPSNFCMGVACPLTATMHVNQTIHASQRAIATPHSPLRSSSLLSPWYLLLSSPLLTSLFFFSSVPEPLAASLDHSFASLAPRHVRAP
eukprot:766666-Hanusia_phi.AAC.3